MKLGRLGLVTVLLVLMLGGCGTNRANGDDVETWEVRPFYRELRFLVVGEDTGAQNSDPAA